MTPLMLASRAGCRVLVVGSPEVQHRQGVGEVIRLLLENGADPRGEDMEIEAAVLQTWL